MNSFAVHKYYMSICHVDYDKNKKTIQITLRVFIDDLQTEFNSTIKSEPIELATDREPKNIDSIYNYYLKEALNIEINNNEKKIEYIGKKYDHDMAIFYLEILDVQEIKSIKIQNNILCSLFSEQENIIKTDINDIKKSHIITKNDNNALINY